MPKEAHNKAAEHHDIAAKSHRLAACVSACNFDPLMRGIGVQN